MSASFPERSAAEDRTFEPSEQRRLLVWVGNDPQAEALVRHAAALARAQKRAWTAICVVLPGHKDDGGRPATALRALALAESLGAHSATIHGDDVIVNVVDCARRVRAGIVMVGGHVPGGWLDGLPRNWLSGLAEALAARLPDATVDVVYLPSSPQTVHGVDTSLPAPHWRVLPGWLHAIGVVLICMAISEIFLPGLEHASVAVIYLAGVVYVALRHGESASMLAVGLSILLFNLLVVEPRWSLSPIDSQYYFTFLVMAIVGLLVSRLADKARRNALVAAARARRAQALSDLSERLLPTQALVDIEQALKSALHDTFGAEVVLLPARPQDRFDAAIASCNEQEAALARRAQSEARAVASTAGDVIAIPLLCTEGPLAVMVARWHAERTVTPEDRRLLEAFANQAALALQRLWSEQRSAAAAVEAEAEKLRNTLLSGISHDLRTPLTSIIGSAASLLEQRDELDASSRSSLLRNIVEEAGRMHRAMSDLLDLTRMEQGAVLPRCEWCPADELVQEARDALGARLQLHVVKVVVPHEAIVWCDARLVQQVLVNLLDNAVRHTPAGSLIEVSVQTSETTWALVVEDDGPGLPPLLRHDPFKKFAHGRGEAPAAGTGLGLALCAAVARLHGGRMEYPQRQGVGARFMLTLPQPTAPQSALEEAA